MKRVVAVLVLGLLALGVQGGLALALPRSLCPDLGFLVVLAIGLHWQQVTAGLFVASALGFAADLLSSSIFGAHALLRVVAFAITALARSQMDLRGGVAFALFAGGITVLYALCLLVLTRLSVGAEDGFPWWEFSGAFPHALVNGLLAPFVSTWVVRVCDRLEGEANRPSLEIDPGRAVT